MAPTSGSMSRGLSSGWWASGWRMAAGTASGSGGRCGRRSTAQSTCWKGSWSSSGPPAALRRRGRRRQSGEEYLLERRLFRRLSTGEPADERYLAFAHPNRWYYDVLRGLDYFRSAGVLTGAAPDARLGDALEHVRSKQREDGTWALDWTPRGQAWFDVDEGVGEPSRWLTLRAMRVLRWAEGRG